MHKRLIRSAIVLVSLLPAIGALASPFDSIPPINSSHWAVDPVKYGMTPEVFVRSTALEFMKGHALHKIGQSSVRGERGLTQFLTQINEQSDVDAPS